MQEEKRDRRDMQLEGIGTQIKQDRFSSVSLGKLKAWLPRLQSASTGQGGLARQRAELLITPTVPGARPPKKLWEHRTGMG